MDFLQFTLKKLAGSSLPYIINWMFLQYLAYKFQEKSFLTFWARFNTANIPN